MIKFVAIAISLYCFTASAEQPPVVLGTLHIPPFVECDKQRVVDGLDVRIIKQLFEKIDQPLELKCLPWKRGLYLTAAGKIDGLFPAFRNNERQQWASFVPTPLHYESIVVATLKDKQWPFSSNRDLVGKTIAVDLGHYFNPHFSAMVKAGDINTVGVKKGEHGLNMLKRGLVDGYLGNTTVIGHLAKQMGIESRITTLPHLLQPPEDTLLMLSNKSKHMTRILPLLTSGLKSMRQEKQIQAITDQYLDIELGLSDLYCPQHRTLEIIQWHD